MSDDGTAPVAIDDLRAASAVLDVPGTPLSLRLEGLEPTGAGTVLTWSYLDPESWAGDKRAGTRRITGRLTVEPEAGTASDVARRWWARAQLEAGRRYQQQIDADWTPGEPFVDRRWTPDDAWDALVEYLGRHGRPVVVDDGVIRVGDDTYPDDVYVIDPHAWAAYLNAVETAGDDPEERPEHRIVPVGRPTTDGLPTWAADELDETNGSQGPAVGLVDGELVGGLPHD
ncbi:hypothetical protein [Solicola sp. PLA-1-18]|uniref:hypothetical protein n=1 Tax=Solicola sp. PLA-1-18 TaxID=3380532 RepID=UPI003B7A8756